MDQLSSARPGLGAFIRLARIRAKLTQRELSLAIERSPAYVNKLESDSIVPSFVAIASLAVALPLSPLEMWVLCRLVVMDARHTPGAYLTSPSTQEVGR